MRMGWFNCFESDENKMMLYAYKFSGENLYFRGRIPEELVRQLDMKELPDPMNKSLKIYLAKYELLCRKGWEFIQYCWDFSSPELENHTWAYMVFQKLRRVSSA